MIKIILKSVFIILIFISYSGAQQNESWKTFTTADGLANNYVSSIWKTSKNIQWFGTYGGGISPYQENTFQPAITETNGLASNFVNVIYETTTRILLIGTDNGLSVYQDNTIIKNFLNSRRVLSICETSDQLLWVGTEDGIRRFIFKDEGIIPTNPPVSPLMLVPIFAICEASDGAVWFGTRDGAVRFHQETWQTFDKTAGLSDNYVLAILEASDGSLWFGTGNGVTRYYQGKWTRFNTSATLAPNEVNALIEAADSALWVGTSGGGVSRFYQGQWKNFTKADGLADNYVTALCESDKNIFWFGTYGKGVSRYVQASTAISNQRQIPPGFELFQNYPNPFNANTTIRYQLPETGIVDLRIFNIKGESVMTLVNQQIKPKGIHTLAWDGRRENGEFVASGIYLLKLSAGDFTQSRFVVYLK